VKSEPLRVFFDGECGLCSASVAWALRRDRAGLIIPTAAQSAEAVATVGEARAARLLDELHTWSPTEGLRVGPEAVASLLSRLPGWAWLSFPLRQRWTIPLTRPAYRWVARHRSWLGRPSCPIPASRSGSQEPRSPAGR